MCDELRREEGALDQRGERGGRWPSHRQILGRRGYLPSSQGEKTGAHRFTTTEVGKRSGGGCERGRGRGKVYPDWVRGELAAGIRRGGGVGHITLVALGVKPALLLSTTTACPGGHGGVHLVVVCAYCACATTMPYL